MPIIEVKNLYKAYDSVKAVDGVDFAVQKGEIFGILGPNGAGKTTTLEILEGLNTPDTGQVNIAGFDALAEPKKVKQIIGVQLQSENFFEYLSLSEILEVFASFYRMEVNTDEILSKVNLIEKRSVYYKNLSGGQQRRFSLALTLLHQPQILFLDEPTTGLDPQSRRYVWELIKEIKKEGTTVVLTTHYMEEAEVLCDHLAIMDGGKIISLGTPAELIARIPVKNFISFSAKKYLASADLERLYGVEKIYRTNGTYHIETGDPTATLYRLLQENFDASLGLYNFSLRKPTLEDVFLHLTGHKLRE